jgi:high affinity sulfate transporter 1
MGDGQHVSPGAPPSAAAAETAYGEAPAFRPARKEPLLARAIPVSAELPSYRTPSARRDLVAGVTVAALALPSAMAWGELAGLSPVNGLYALLLPTVAYVLLGSSRRLIVGPDASVSTLVGAAVLSLAVAGSAAAVELASTLALLVAACFLLARVLRLGWLADYFSRPVLVGYIHGVAIALLIGQLGKLLGLSIDARDPLEQLAEVVRELDAVSGLTATVGATALAALLVLRAFVRWLPGALLVVVGAIGVSWWLELERHGVAVIGPVAGGLPSVTLPTPPLEDVLRLAPAAAGIFLVSFADEILTARAFAGKRGEHVRASQELLAMGAANAASGFTQSFSIAASGSRTAVNDSMGARTQIAALVAAGTVLAILLFLTEPVQYLPKAVLAAVVVSAALNVFDRAAWRALAAVDRVEVAIAAVTTGCVVVLGVLEALVVAVGLSVVDAVRRSARPYDAVLGWVEELGRYGNVALNRTARVTAGVVVYRLDDRLFFANARYVKGRVREAIRAAPTETSWLVFDAEAVTHVDSTGVEALGELTRDLRSDGVTLVVAKLRRRLLDQLEAAGVADEIGPERFYPTIRRAVAAFAEDQASAGSSVSSAGASSPPPSSDSTPPPS